MLAVGLVGAGFVAFLVRSARQRRETSDAAPQALPQPVAPAPRPAPAARPVPERTLS